jgi:hypothetical protein
MFDLETELHQIKSAFGILKKTERYRNGKREFKKSHGHLQQGVKSSINNHTSADLLTPPHHP